VRAQKFYLYCHTHWVVGPTLGCETSLQWSQTWSQGSRSAKTLDPWDRPWTRSLEIPQFYSNESNLIKKIVVTVS
jgi:hypothetical protein